MNARLAFAGIAALALAGGFALWHLGRPAPATPAPGITPPALYAASFTDAEGRTRSLGQFQGKLLVLNFWATWCAPCREEMPAFNRVHGRWKERGVQVLGLSAEDAAKVGGFARDLAIGYPLWTGGEEISELSRRLGNRIGVLPHTVFVGPTGEVLESRVGPYTESQLEERLATFSSKTVQMQRTSRN